MFFGFTNCPGICPTTLLRMTDLLAKLGPDADKLQVVLVSVDPERDTPEILKSYLEQFDPRFSAMTGTPEQLAVFAKGYRFVYKKVALDGTNYAMDHSAGCISMTPKGLSLERLICMSPTMSYWQNWQNCSTVSTARGNVRKHMRSNCKYVGQGGAPR